jgi:predicted 3-demethylubiquinone-9 3-methyltransferase (glyoxalase superfamily)
MHGAPIVFGGTASVFRATLRQERCANAEDDPVSLFENQVEEAVDFYLSVFPDSRVTRVARYGEAGPGPAGSVMTIHFELDGNESIALNGGSDHYGCDESIAFMVDCATRTRSDLYWEALTDGGEEIACGWLKDRYGLPWQVLPSEWPTGSAIPIHGLVGRLIARAGCSG